MHARSKPATYEDLARLRDEGRAVELIDGVIVEKAAPTAEHGSAQMKLGALLDPMHRRMGGPGGPGGWWLMTEVEVRYRSGDVYRHDALGFRRELHPERPRGLPLDVRPDWVCEILSTSTARNDLVKKQRTLHHEKVPYYWLIDPQYETLSVLRWNETAYLKILDAGVDEVVRAEPFETIQIAIAELFGRET
jgi:Uma2 family endonuclease